MNGQLSVDFYDDLVPENCSLACGGEAWSLEAFVVGYADEIAQRHHDIEDGYFAGVLGHKETIALVNDTVGQYAHRHESSRTALARMNERGNYQNYLPYASKVLVDVYVSDLIDCSMDLLENFRTNANCREWRQYLPLAEARKLINWSDEIATIDKMLQGKLRNRILNSFAAQRMDGRGQYIIRKLYEAYISNPHQLHNRTIWRVFKQYDDTADEDASDLRDRLADVSLRESVKFHNCLVRAICDHIAGMTDQFVLSEYRRLYGISQGDKLYGNGA